MKQFLFITFLLSCMLARSQDTISIAGSSFYLKNKVLSSSVQIGYVSFDKVSRTFSVGGVGGYPINFSYDNVVSFKIDGTVATISIGTIIDSLNARKYVASSGGGGSTPSSVAVNNFPATQPISAVSLPLASGAATNAAQTTAQTSFTSMDSKLSVVMDSTKSRSLLNVNIMPRAVGSTAPTITTYNTNSNSITTTGVNQIVVENFSTTTNATVTYGGRAFPIGYKGNANGYNTSYTFGWYDHASGKWAPLLTTTIDASGADLSLTKFFGQ